MIPGTTVRPVRLRPLLGPELTAESGRLDWVAVDEVLRGHSVPLTRQEWRAVADHLCELRRQFHGDVAVSLSAWTPRTSPYLAMVQVVAAALGVSLTEVTRRLSLHWEARRRRERYAEKKRREEES